MNNYTVLLNDMTLWGIATKCHHVIYCSASAIREMIEQYGSTSYHIKGDYRMTLARNEHGGKVFFRNTWLKLTRADWSKI